MKPGPRQRREELRVLFIAAEADPLIKMGGLGDVAGSLPLALKQANPGMDIRLAIPHYHGINTAFPIKFLSSYSIPSETGPIQVDVSRAEVNGLPIYLIGGDPLHAKEPVYPKNNEILTERFVFFSVACLHLPDHLGWPIDILHANDWHTAVALHALRTQTVQNKATENARSVLTVHNLPFMGSGSENALKRFKIIPAVNPDMPEWARKIPLPMGLNAADRIVPVSPGYASEILTPGYGCDLQNFLLTKKQNIVGIINGIDYGCWDPQKDPEIVRNYAKGSTDNRLTNKQAIQNEMQLPIKTKIPLFAVIGRLDRQKGLDIIIDVFAQMEETEWQLIVLAFGNDENLRKGLLSLQKKYPDRVRFKEEMNLVLSRRLYSSADMLLMPSRYEPCGLAQMIAMHYGCIPIATATGGLKDTIQDYSVDVSTATGFLSAAPDVDLFADQVKLAITVFTEHAVWEIMQQNGMTNDFSWKKPADQYLALYEELTR